MFAGTRHGNNSSGYRADAVTVTGEYYERNMALFSSNSNVCLFSFWARYTNVAAATNWIFDTGRIGIQVSTLGAVFASFNNASGGSAVAMHSSAVPLTDNAWFHVMGAVDSTDGSKCFLYINKTSDKILTSSGGGPIDFVSLPTGLMTLFVSTSLAGGAEFDIAELFITDSWLDLSLPANQAKFVRGRTPVYLGQDGSKVLGVQPKLYMAGKASNFGTNKGSGGALTPSAGSIVDSAHEPVKF